MLAPRGGFIFLSLPPHHCYLWPHWTTTVPAVSSFLHDWVSVSLRRRFNIFLQEHAQIRIESRHTLPARQSSKSVKWHFHLWTTDYKTLLFYGFVCFFFPSFFLLFFLIVFWWTWFFKPCHFRVFFHFLLSTFSKAKPPF